MVRPSSAPPGSAAPAMGLEAKPTPSVSRQWLATVLRRTSIWGVGSAWNLPPSRRPAALAGGRVAGGETGGVARTLHEPIRRDIAFSAIEEAGDGCAVFFERGACDAGMVAGVESTIGVAGEGSL